ncbi:MAG: LacI family transcriptional regulator [Lachnospiraceae bacterium]|nr:LacI family transcriptional regulator [Lachnospiraceae bacterium]
MNIYDIAKLAGVSIATVSRVVNDSAKVSGKTRAKVLGVMEEVGYIPNIFARGLGLNSMRTIGILCPDISDIYMANAVSYLEKNLNKHGYDCILGCSGHRQEEKEKYIKLLLSKRIDTLVLVGSTYAGKGDNPAETEYLRLAAKETPIFMINAYVPGENIYCAYADDFQAAYEVTAAYIRRGKKRILFLSNARSFSGDQKRAGYEKALIDNAYPVDGALIFYSEHSIHDTRDMLLLNKKLEFDGVLATEDSLAIAAVKYAKTKNLAIPAELSVVGFNNSRLSICCEPELTTIDNKGEILCAVTVEQMISLLEEKVQPKEKISVPCEIIKRNTTDF